jgi:hypothetical protein
MSVKWGVVVGGIAMLAGALRLWNVGVPVLSNDEAYSWRITQDQATDLVFRTRADANPPFYYLLLQCWAQLWGTSPWALRSRQFSEGGSAGDFPKTGAAARGSV